MLQLRRILLARDFSAASNQALRYAVDLARRTDARLYLLYAEVLYEDPFGPVSPEGAGAPEDRIRSRLRQDVDSTLLTARYPGLDVQEGVERDIAAGPAILSYAADHDIDLIVMGTHGRRGMRRLLLGSVAEEVIRRADRPVLTVGRNGLGVDDAPGFERILVPIDFSGYAQDALRYAQALADLYRAKIDLLHVIEENLHPAFYVGSVRSIYEVVPDIEAKVHQRLQALYDEVVGPEAPEVDIHVMPGRAPRAIVQCVEKLQSDLVVMSTHGQTGLEHFLLGSVAEKVIRTVQVPVFTVRAFGKSVLKPMTEAGAATA